MADVRRHVPYGDPCDGPGCWACAEGVGFAGWDHSVWRTVAVMLAEPLRKAFDAHLDEHRCGDPYVGIGFAHCREAMELWDLLPDGDRIVIA